MAVVRQSFHHSCNVTLSELIHQPVMLDQQVTIRMAFDNDLFFARLRSSLGLGDYTFSYKLIALLTTLIFTLLLFLLLMLPLFHGIFLAFSYDLIVIMSRRLITLSL